MKKKIIMWFLTAAMVVALIPALSPTAYAIEHPFAIKLRELIPTSTHTVGILIDLDGDGVEDMVVIRMSGVRNDSGGHHRFNFILVTVDIFSLDAAGNIHQTRGMVSQSLSTPHGGSVFITNTNHIVAHSYSWWGGREGYFEVIEYRGRSATRTNLVPGGFAGWDYYAPDTRNGVAISTATLRSYFNRFGLNANPRHRVLVFETGLDIPASGPNPNTIRTVTSHNNQILGMIIPPNAFPRQDVSVSVDGVNTPLRSYVIDGSTYVNILDLAMALSGTEHQFRREFVEGDFLRMRLIPGADHGRDDRPLLAQTTVDYWAITSGTRYWIAGQEVSITTYTIGDHAFVPIGRISEVLGLPFDSSTFTISTSVPLDLAEPARTFVSAGGISTAIRGYRFEGSTFVGLRDLALALSGTDYGFSLSYDSATGIISLFSQNTFTDGEIAPPSTEPAVVSPDDVRILFDGASIDVMTIRIGGAIYVPIGRFSEVLGINLNLDSAAGTFTLEAGAVAGADAGADGSLDAAPAIGGVDALSDDARTNGGGGISMLPIIIGVIGGLGLLGAAVFIMMKRKSPTGASPSGASPGAAPGAGVGYAPGAAPPPINTYPNYTPPPAAPPAAVTTCPKCTAPQAQSTGFCGICGHKL